MYIVRKLLISAAIGALSAAGAVALPAAHAVSGCGTGVSQPSLGATSGTVRVGVDGVGCITGSGSAADLSGFVIADGAPSNPGQSSGYIGIVRDGNGVTLIGCGSGDASESNAGRGSNAPGDHVNNDLSANPVC